MRRDDILKLATELTTKGDPLHAQYRRIDKMYFMDPSESERGIDRPATDPTDVKLTISPSVRNAVIGLVRLLTTNEPHFKAKSESGAGNLDRIEDLCRLIWTESCRQKKAELHVDLVRSAALYSDCHLAADYVEDLIATADEYEQRRLAPLAKRVPALFEVRSPLEDYLYWGRYGLRGVLRKWKMRGDDIKAQFDRSDMQLGDTEEYAVCDWTDTEARMVWMEGQEAPGDELVPWSEHGLQEILFGAQVADGSELWRDDDKARQPFLYAMDKGNLWRRDNGVLTEIFTSMNERGTGILIGFDQPPEEVVVKYAGPGLRYIQAPQPKVLSESALDPNLMAVRQQILSPLIEGSTIFPQSLGSAEGMSDAPFSSIAMLSQSGQLPTVPVRKAVSNVIANVALAVLRRIRLDPPVLPLPFGMTAMDIPEDLELDVTLEIKLPQDMFKNVQVAETAIEQGIITKEWARENLLQISDSRQMTFDIWREMSAEEAYKALLAGFIQANTQPPAQPGAETGGETSASTDQAAGGVTATPGGGSIPASQPMAPAGTNPPEVM